MSRSWTLTNGQWTDGAGRPIETAPLQNYALYARSAHSGTRPGIPLEVAQEAYKEYASQYGTSQSLQRLNERGGFDATELAILLFERIQRLTQGKKGDEHG